MLTPDQLLLLNIINSEVLRKNKFDNVKEDMRPLDAEMFNQILLNQNVIMLTMLGERNPEAASLATRKINGLKYNEEYGAWQTHDMGYREA